MKLILFALAIVLLTACSEGANAVSSSSNMTPVTVKQEPLPNEIKQQILLDLQNGGRLNSAIVSGGTGQFASMNGGELTTIDNRGDTIHTFKLKAEWTTDATAWLKEIGH